MYLMVSKKTRRTNRKRTSRYTAKLNAKNRRRRARVCQQA